MSDQHREGYWRDRRATLRAARGVSPHADYDHLFVNQGRELAAMLHASAVQAPRTLTIDNTKCPCGKLHNNRVPSTPIQNAHGRGWNIVWYCKHECKNKYGASRNG